MKKKVKVNTNNRFAMSQEAAEAFISSMRHYTMDEDGWYTDRKPDGEIDYRNNVTRHDDGIAVIHIDGALGYRAISESWWGLYGDYYDGIQAALDDCMNDDSVLGIVLDINSPGGTVNGCSDLAEKIFKCRGRKIYGIVARTGGQMQSGAYWLASACEKIYASETGIVGSIGTLMQFDMSDEKNTLTIVSSYSPNKYPDPATDSGKKTFKKELDALAKVFIDTVARNRGYTSEYVMQNFGQGGNLIGEAAVQAGMIDAVMSFEDMCDQMKKVSNVQTNEVIMAESKTAAPAAAAPTPAATSAPDVESIKAEGIKEYKARAAAIKGIFAGLPVDEAKMLEFIDGDKTIEQISACALDIAKAELKKKTDTAEAAAKDKTEVSTAGLTPEQVAAVKDGLEAQASAQNGIIGGAGSDDVKQFQDLKALCKSVSDKFYNKKG